MYVEHMEEDRYFIEKCTLTGISLRNVCMTVIALRNVCITGISLRNVCTCMTGTSLSICMYDRYFIES